MLKAHGCKTIYADDSASRGSQLAAALFELKSGDTLVVVRLDRLGKTIKGVVDFLNEMSSRSITFIAIEDAVDTSSTGGLYLVNVMARLTLMDKALVNERTKHSLAIARAKGRTGGRPPVITQEKLAEAQGLIDGGMPVRAAAKAVGSSQATLYRLLGAKRLT